MTSWTIAHQAPLSIEFSRQEYWSGLPFSSPGDFPNPGIEPGSPALQVDSFLEFSCFFCDPKDVGNLISGSSTLASLVAQMIKHLITMEETCIQSLGWENPLEKEMATHFSILDLRISWTEEPGGL